MRILIIAIVLLSVASAAYAEDVFVDTKLKHIQIVEVTEESVFLQSTDNTAEEAFIGDIIGSEAAEVVEIGPDFITLQTETTTIKMPVLAGSFPKN
jgi:peptide subunit release factor RF-3